MHKEAYHAMSSDEVLARLQSSSAGLSAHEVTKRRARYGANRLPEGKRVPGWLLFLRQFHSPLIYIIFAAAIAAFFSGHPSDAIFIIVVIVINTVVGFFQEYKAEKALEALQASVEYYTRVVRDGGQKRITAADVVPGDICVLSAGDIVSADARLIESRDLMVSEAQLTGESVPVQKVAAVLARDTTLPERANMVFAGTAVEEGSGLCVVTATGALTQLGKISQLVQAQEETKTPLQKKFFVLARLIGVAILAIIALFAVVSVLRGANLQEIFITSTALVVSAIPGGLLPAITVVLVLGMRRLARRKALVRKLNANEAMGSVTAICMDKTGTLTEGKMQVGEVFAGAAELLRGAKLSQEQKALSVPHDQVLRVAGLTNDAYVENPTDPLGQRVVRGRATDAALLQAALIAGTDPSAYNRYHTLLESVAFTSSKKYASRTFVDEHDMVDTFVLGAPEKVLGFSSTLIDDATTPMLDDAARGKILHVADALAQQGLRVLACAQRTCSRADYDAMEQKVQGLTFLGLIALTDPVRSDVQEALHQTQQAGIRPLVITGDHRHTAAAVMRSLGYRLTDKDIMEGKTIDTLNDTALRERVQQVSLYARVSPEHKIRIVKALQENKQIVAMVGDGVNDAPALKAADVGIAVGSGTTIAKEVSDIVLLDDSFSVVASAIEQGRLIFDNIRRVLIYLLADDFSELFLFVVALIVGFPLPLLAAQILWINVIENGFPDIALTTEKDTRGLMDRPPRNPAEPLLSWPYKKFMIATFLVTGLGAVGVFTFFWQTMGDLALARTATFALIAFDSLTFAYVVRSFHRSVFRPDLFSNWFLNGAVVISLGLLVAGIHLPFLQQFLKTVPLDQFAWSMVIGVTVVEMLLLEIAKKWFLRKENKG